jgi:hypothetical protein
LEGGQRGSWVKGGEKITELVKIIRAGLLSKFGKGSGKVVVAIEDPTGSYQFSFSDLSRCADPALFRLDALLVTLALATSSYKPIVIAPGSSIPDESDIVGIVHSITKFVSARGVSANPDAVVILLGDESDVADDIFATGKAIVSGGGGGPEEVGKSSPSEPSDLALTVISEGISLDFSQVASPTSRPEARWSS